MEAVWYEMKSKSALVYNHVKICTSKRKSVCMLDRESCENGRKSNITISIMSEIIIGHIFLQISLNLRNNNHTSLSKQGS